MENKKPVKVVIDASITTAKQYELFLFKQEEEGMEIHFADRIETDNDIEIHVQNRILIEKEKMQAFLFHMFDALVDYEKQFQNGYGLTLPEETEGKE